MWHKIIYIYNKKIIIHELANTLVIMQVEKDQSLNPIHPYHHQKSKVIVEKIIWTSLRVCSNLVLFIYNRSSYSLWELINYVCFNLAVGCACKYPLSKNCMFPNVCPIYTYRLSFVPFIICQTYFRLREISQGLTPSSVKK